MSKFLYCACFLALIQLSSYSFARDVPPNGEYEELYDKTWAQGIDDRLVLQAPRDAISVVDSPEFHEPTLKISIRRDDNFQGVANGTPRGEIAFARIFHFVPGVLYEVNWSMALPRNYQIDSLQPELFSQILQGPKGGLGPPPFSIRFVDGRYQVEIRNAANVVPRVFIFGDAFAEKGKIVHWTLRYRADHSGVNAITDLFMNGASVVHCEGCGNAYAGDPDAYFKIGIYKWWWQSRHSDVNERTIYFGNVEVKRFFSR
ncbi:heparin lyase I family protein [Paraburkholderia unamae]|uniref:heparin lyase I family protein n=1 Tax=Paraburkholderia unamae TaxID=219649 RepID=UPI001CC3F7CE|nr:heparin lyase I family protein [Paraburkholderia unamae]